jgi:hypothetical protein
MSIRMEVAKVDDVRQLAALRAAVTDYLGSSLRTALVFAPTGERGARNRAQSLTISRLPGESPPMLPLQALRLSGGAWMAVGDPANSKVPHRPRHTHNSNQAKRCKYESR